MKHTDRSFNKIFWRWFRAQPRNRYIERRLAILNTPKRAENLKFVQLLQKPPKNANFLEALHAYFA